MKTNEIIKKILDNVPDLSENSLKPLSQWIEDLYEINNIITSSNRLMFTEGSFNVSIISSIVDSNNLSNEKSLKLKTNINELQTCKGSEIPGVMK